MRGRAIHGHLNARSQLGSIKIIIVVVVVFLVRIRSVHRAEEEGAREEHEKEKGEKLPSLHLRSSKKGDEWGAQFMWREIGF